MMRSLIIVCLISVATLAQSAAPIPKDTPIRIQFPHSELAPIIKLYQQLTQRKTWIDAELRFDVRIDLVSQRDLLRDDAVTFVRDTLRKAGIDIREVGDSEA